jgi:histidinol phosphatase-like enzyme
LKEAILLDRDGVINENQDDRVRSWEEVRGLPSAVEVVGRDQVEAVWIWSSIVREAGIRELALVGSASGFS